MPDRITLGSAEVDVFPQRHAYLTNRLGPVIQGVLERGDSVTPDNLIGIAGDGVYDVLCALIPQLSKRVPRWEFLGYGSADALAAGAYVEEDDHSPTLPEIREAFSVGMRVNGIDGLVSLLGKVIDPRLIRAEVNSALVTSLESRKSPLTSGGSESTSSGATAPTLTENTDSPSTGSPA